MFLGLSERTGEVDYFFRGDSVDVSIRGTGVKLRTGENSLQ